MGLELGTAMLVSSLVGTGGSIAAGALNRKGKTTTTRPVYTAEQEHLQQLLAGKLEQESLDPAKGLAPLKRNRLGRTNRMYDQVGDRVQKSLTARGFGKSGKVQSRLKDVELARVNAMGDVEAEFSGRAVEQNNRLMQMMQQYGFSGAGSAATGPGMTTGDMIGSATDSASETAMFLYALSKLSGGGRSGGVGGLDI